MNARLPTSLVLSLGGGIEDSPEHIRANHFDRRSNMPSLPEEFQPDADDTTAIRRRTDGTGALWLLRKESDRTILTRWDKTGTGAWSTPRATDFRLPCDAIRSDPDLTTLGINEATEYTTRDVDTLLDLLTPDGAAGEPNAVEWPFDVDDYLGDDEDFCGHEGLTQRYARINGCRVQFAESSGNGVVAFFTSEDRVSGTSLAEFAWSTEYGGSASALIRTTTGRAVACGASDLGGVVHGFRFCPDPQGTAHLIHEWLQHVEYLCLGAFGAAAIALEPFDPTNELAPAMREEWQERIAGLSDEYSESLRMKFAVDEDANVAAREVLRSNATYRTIADAFSHPATGDWLLAALSEGDLDPLR
ncbi:MAG TPA: hypothetical protein VG502_16200 [Flexivirga sp.]|uniref:hypothetical protein n=1 Tax=Flexivirga sp. TaxID=1962927 RepID=UPI002B92F266|nr:hypothetical protein [Flexivirga sp.]HWC23838.1 hypothetical protein [Flexivirga sp.]